jgi:carboxyl-terminal processing protease
MLNGVWGLELEKWSARKRIVLVFLSIIVLVSAFGAGFGVAQVVPLSALPILRNDSASLDTFWQVWRLVEHDFLGTLPSNQARVYGAIHGSLATLDDPYTVFVEPQSHQREKEDLQGSFGGIGVTMRRNAQGDLVLSPMPDSPAIRTGVLENDVLVAVDGKPISATLSFDDIAALVRGKVGTKVTISVQRSGSEALLSFTITREVINTPSVAYHILDNAPQIGYIVINRFTERSGEEAQKAAQELEQKGARQMILDLRDNGGGLLTAAIDVSSQFLSDGVVLYEQEKGKPERAFRTKPGGVALDMPLIILVNHNTASASEIVAGALRDNNRAILIGDQTYGKGSVQHIYDLGDGSSLHVTAAEWFTPNRHQLTRHGLIPDVIVSRSNDDLAAGRDPQLDRAIAYWQDKS